jgi:hypothetical protein
MIYNNTDDKIKIIEGRRGGPFTRLRFNGNSIRNSFNKLGRWFKQNLDPCKSYRNKIDSLDRIISNGNNTIANLNNQISSLNDYIMRCTNTNNKIINKNNALLDTTQYFKDLLFGTNKVDGYVKSILHANIAKDKIQNQTISGYVKDGFRGARKGNRNRNKGICGPVLRRIDDRNDQISQKNDKIEELRNQISILNNYKNTCYNNNNRLMKKNNVLLDTSQFFENQTNEYDKMLIKMHTDETNLLNKKISDNIEGFDSGYNKVTNENAIIQNQININQQQHSIDNQLYIDLDNRIQFLKSLNEILSVFLFAVIIISAVIIWRSDKSLTHKLVMVKVVWLYVIIVEIFEYILFYVVQYLRALFFGKPYNTNDFWKFPELTWIDICILILIVLSVFI